MLLLLFFVIINSTYSQKHKTAIHIYNPIGMFQKAGAKLEYRTNTIGFLIMGIKYYGSLPKYPGTQAGLELRLYSKNEDTKKHENFFYSKFFGGHQDYSAGEGDGFTRKQEVPESDYYGLGAGWGRHFNFNHFFIDFNTGLKYTISNPKQNTAFYLTGPGSYLDLHFNLGYQF